MLFGKRPGQVLSSMLQQAKNYSHSKQTPVVNRLSVFQSPDEDEEEDYEQWLEIKGKWRFVLLHCLFGGSGLLPVAMQVER